MTEQAKEVAKVETGMDLERINRNLSKLVGILLVALICMALLILNEKAGEE